MTMDRAWQTWKGTARIVLTVLIVMDLCLAFFLWQSSREGPQTMRAQRDRLMIQAELLKADVQHGEQIRASLPQVGRDCDTFYNESFLNAATGYSSIQSDMNSIADKAGVRTSGLAFQQKIIEGRGVTEISIKTKVEADYPALIRFVNNIERSKNFYLLDDLRLTSATAGSIKLDITLHTYFRT
ncbi:MAG: GspMb/PilO family protein [Candidatus Acidiferrales bacterium]